VLPTVLLHALQCWTITNNILEKFREQKLFFFIVVSEHRVNIAEEHRREEVGRSREGEAIARIFGENAWKSNSGVAVVDINPRAGETTEYLTPGSSLGPLSRYFVVFLSVFRRMSDIT
jgi:hypothetical protein